MKLEEKALTTNRCDCCISPTRSSHRDSDLSGPPAENAAPASDFWKRIPLRDMDRHQWEALCDGCGKCCLFKVEDAATAQVFYTNVVCRLFDQDSCRCGAYDERSELVPNCVTLSMETLSIPSWLPATCAYRLLDEGRELPSWHPLVSGTPDTVLSSGNSICGRAVGETEADDLEHHLIDWVT